MKNDMFEFDSTESENNKPKHQDGPLWNIKYSSMAYIDLVKEKEKLLSDSLFDKTFDIKIKKLNFNGQTTFVLKIRKKLSILLKEQKEIEEQEKIRKQQIKQNHKIRNHQNKKDHIKNRKQEKLSS